MANGSHANAPRQTLPGSWGRRRSRLSFQRGTAMRTVSESVSETVSTEYAPVLPNCEGILWYSARIWIEFNQKNAKKGTNPSLTASFAKNWHSLRESCVYQGDNSCMNPTPDTPEPFFQAVPGHTRLFRREGGTYYLRAKVPLPLRPIVGKTEIRKSLNTKALKEAAAGEGRIPPR